MPQKLKTKRNELTKKLLDIDLSSIIYFTGRKTILKVMAETWEEYYSKAEEMDPSEYLSLVYEAVSNFQNIIFYFLQDLIHV